LGSFGITHLDLPEIATKAAQSSSMKGNPVPLSQEELLDILRQAL